MRIQLILIMLVLFSSFTFAEFLFLDHSFPFENKLRVCNNIECEYLESGNYTTLSNIATVQESKNKYEKIDIWDSILNNSNIMIIGILIIVILVIIGNKILSKK